MKERRRRPGREHRRSRVHDGRVGTGPEMPAEINDRVAQLDQLRRQVAQLESDIAAGLSREPSWPPRTYYTAYHLLAGMVLGLIASAASLVFNIVGAAMRSPWNTWPQSLKARLLVISRLARS